MISFGFLDMRQIDFRPMRILTDGEKGTLLAGRHFRDIRLDNVDLSGSDLRNTVFERVSLRLCDFSAADLRNARFTNCDLSGARFDNAIIVRCRFEAISLSRASANGNTRVLRVAQHPRRPSSLE